MSIYLISARIAQVGGLALALFFGTMWLGSRTPLPIASQISRAFLDAHGTPTDMLFVAGFGFALFVLVTALIAYVGDAARNMHDLRKSGWR